MTTEMSAGRSFNRLFTIAALALALLAGGLFVLSALSGPRLRQAQVDTRLVASQTNQRLVLHANQPLANIDSKTVTITPAAVFTVANTASNINITFKQRLDYGTTYTVTVNRATAQYGKKRQADFRYSFTTYNPTVYYLKRAGLYNRQDAEPDQIFQNKQLLYSASRIVDYVLLDDSMVVSTANDIGMSSLSLVNLRSRMVTSFKLPATGSVGQLHASPDGKKYGFRFTSSEPAVPRQYENVLFVHDTSPGHLMVPLEGLDSKPLQVMDWQFAPDGSTVVAQAYDTSLLLVDTNFKNRPAGLGQFRAMGNFGAGGTRMVVRDEANYTVLDLINRRRLGLQLKPAMLYGAEPISMERQFLVNQEGFIDQLQASYDQGSRFINYITVLTAKGQRILYQANTDDRTLLAYYATPNDQRIAIEQASTKGLYDGYPDANRPPQVQTILIDSITGKTTDVIDGFNVQWQ